MINAEILPNNTLRVKESTVSDGILFDKIHFTFPNTWKNYAKVAVFSTDEVEPIIVVLNASGELCCGTNTCYIPYEVLQHPGFYVSAFGVKGDSKATATRAFVDVLESGYAKGGAPADPTPDQYSQLLDIAQTALDTAESVRADADNGLFRGEKGEKGDTGPKGDKGDTGEKGEKGDPGIVENIDLNFNSNSENAQSGIAVAQAINQSLGIVEESLSTYFELEE